MKLVEKSCFASFDCAYRRNKATHYVNGKLQHDLDVGLLNGYLELDIKEMNDKRIAFHFSVARKVLDESPLYIFTKHLVIFREITSILAQVTTLASLTSRKSWPILVLTAISPLFDKLIRLIPWGNRHGSPFFHLC